MSSPVHASSVNSSISLSDIITQTARAKTVTGQKVRDIRQVTSKLRILALNALIEAKHAGDKGAGFSVVADEVRSISGEVEGLAKDLGDEIVTLDALTQSLAQQSQGARLTDLALNAIELIDRNLYERTCDVRWWATDSALVNHAVTPTAESRAYACHRLGVILDSYTVYIDLWLCDLNGNVIANGRPDRHHIIGRNVHDRLWFSRAATFRQRFRGGRYHHGTLAGQRPDRHLRYRRAPQWRRQWRVGRHPRHPFRLAAPGGQHHQGRAFVR